MHDVYRGSVNAINIDEFASPESGGTRVPRASRISESLRREESAAPRHD